jgi:hypothetical protein
MHAARMQSVKSSHPPSIAVMLVSNRGAGIVKVAIRLAGCMWLMCVRRELQSQSTQKSWAGEA